ncbi:MAG: nucleotidyltransferase family protein [bacterium]
MKYKVKNKKRQAVVRDKPSLLLMTPDKIKSILTRYKKELKDRFQVKEIGIFGSYLRGEPSNKSDLDILVEFQKDAKLSLLDVADLEITLSQLLGVKVDLVEKKCLKPYIGQRILNEVVYI